MTDRNWHDTVAYTYGLLRFLIFVNLYYVYQEGQTTPGQLPEFPLSQLRSMLGTMYRIRAFEEKVDELFMRGEIVAETPYLLLEWRREWEAIPLPQRP